MRIPRRYPVLRLAFDHTVWQKARKWMADQMARPDSSSADKSRVWWLDNARAQMRKKYPDKVRAARGG